MTKVITIIGCVMLIISTSFATKSGYIWVIIPLSNILSILLITLFLRIYKKSRSFEADEFFETNWNWVIVICGMMGSGILHSAYFIWKFYQYPLTEDTTKEELNAKIQSEKREKLLKKIGI